MSQQRDGVFITGIGQLKVEKSSPLRLREMGAMAIKMAMQDAGIEKVDAIYLGNMLSGMISKQQQLGSIIAGEAGLNGTEAVTLEAACGSGGAAIRNGYMAIKSGLCENVVVCCVEHMSHDDKVFITQSIATASDWEIEGSQGHSFVTLNAALMQAYLDHYKVSADHFGYFGVNAHKNAMRNPNALFHKEITIEDYLQSKILYDSLRIFDASPICDGSAAIVLSKYPIQNKVSVEIKSSAAATEFVGVAKRQNALAADGIRLSGNKALQMANATIQDIDIFELHDAYSIIAVLSLEAMGFAQQGEGWRLAVEGDITLDGKLPISTFGGLKARGHPIGASGVYQAVESYLQLIGKAGDNQVKKDARTALIQSIGGTASSVFSHVLQRVG